MRISALRSMAALLILTLFTGAAVADPNCADAVTVMLKKLAKDEANENRDTLVKLLKKNGVPAYLKQTGSGDIPVVLLNNKTLPQLREFLDNSMGTQIQLQPTWTNDHGMLRVANNLIDVDLPGDRGYGEIHDTGLAWKGLNSYLPRRHAGSDVIVEVAYALKPEEKAAAEYYQRSRRAAIFRVPFTFGGNETDQTLPNLLKDGGENCFTFCNGSAVRNHIYEIERTLEDWGVKDTHAFMADPTTVNFLKAAREKIMAADPKDENDLNNKMLLRLPEYRDLDKVTPRKFAGENKRTFANWIVALDASNQYANVLGALHVTSDIAVRDAANPRATAILVYDVPARAAEFKDGTYSTKGIFYSINPHDQRALP